MFNWNKHVYEYHCSRKAILSNKLANKKQWHNDKKKIHLPMQELQEMQFQSLSREDPQEEEMVTCSSILAWKIPRPEETSGLQSLGLWRVQLDLAHTTAQANYIPVETVDMSTTIKDLKCAGMLISITPAFNIPVGLCRNGMDLGKWPDFQVGRYYNEKMGFHLPACSVCFESETIIWCYLLHNQNLEIKGVEVGVAPLTINT